MNLWEYYLSSALLKACALLFRVFPVRRDKVVFATARATTLEGNLAYIHDEMERSLPGLRYVFLLRRYSYGFIGKLKYLAELVRDTYHLATARLFVIDNAYLPVHVAPHRAETTVVQVWHASGALKRFGMDISAPQRAVENRFIHRYYDWVVVSSASAVGPYSSALRTPAHKVVALGCARTDFFFDEAAMAAARERVWARHPELKGKRVLLYAPTFRGYGPQKHAVRVVDPVELRAGLGQGWALVHKPHPVLPPSDADAQGWDTVADPTIDINEFFCVTDAYVTDYSSSIFEWSLVGKPLVLVVDDLDAYERDPGMYLDMRTQAYGSLVTTTGGVVEALTRPQSQDADRERFVATHMECADGHAARRFVEFVAHLFAES